MINRVILIISTLGFTQFAFAENAGAPPTQDWGMNSMLLFSAMFIMFYFLMIRPQNKRQKEQKDLLSNLVSGDEVIIAGGIVGKISKVTDNFFIVAISDGVEVAVQKHAVASALPKGTMKAL